MARARETGLEAIRDMVREAFLDTASEFSNDPEVFEAHPSELQFASYIDRLLSETEEAAFERHVAMCSDCAEVLVLSTRVAQSQRRRKTSSYWKMAAGIALAMGSLLAALMAGRTTGNYLEGAMLAGLEAGFGGKASARAVSVSLLGGPQVELDGFQVDDPAGGDPLITAPAATFAVELASLRDGEIAGDLELFRPVFNVVRNASGQLNIESFLPTSERLQGILASAAKNAVRSVHINDGTIRFMDKADALPREVRLADVDAKLTELSETSPAKLRARAGLESQVQNLALVGTVGPFGAGTPQYRFSEVDLDSVPLRAMAAVRDAVRGGLSYDGTLQTSGKGWDALTANASGAGAMQVVSGAIVGTNLVAATIRPWIGGGEPPAHLRAVLASTDTFFDEIRSSVNLRQAGLSARDLRARMQGFQVMGGGSLGRTGEVDFAGTMLVSAKISADLIALAPVANRLLDEEGQLAIPFRIAGAWPDLQPRVDLELVASKAFPTPRLALFLFGPSAG